MNSMGMIYDLLCQIRQKYALYIGRKDVRRLGIFLSGYECALFDAMGFFPEFNGRFQQFVGKKLGRLHSSLHWTEMLLDGATEDEAFDKFYVLADEFFASEEEVSAEEIANTVNIDTIFSMLDWNAPEATQAQGRMLARNVRSIRKWESTTKTSGTTARASLPSAPMTSCGHICSIFFAGCRI